jgi:hypothetical protein
MPQAAENIIPLIQMDKDPRAGAQSRISNIHSELSSGNLTGKSKGHQIDPTRAFGLGAISHSIVRSGSIP